MNGIVTNLVMERRKLLNQAFPDRGTRDIEVECGHPPEISLDDYARVWKRKGVAKRVVTIFPKECWKIKPDVYETEDPKATAFEESWDALERKRHVWAYLRRADELSGIGRFGVILIGLNDGLPLERPAAGLDEKGERTAGRAGAEVTYLKCLDETRVTLKDSGIQKDATNPRYGLPTRYWLRLGDAINPMAETEVHWTRIIHVADERTDSEVYGTPRMEDVFDYLADIHKIGGSSAEMFYKGGFPGWATKVLPGVEGMDEKSVREQIELYQEGLQRIIAAFGIELQSLAPQVADPTGSVDLQLKFVSVAKGIPLRILTGSERGELASTQDRESWNERLADRRENYLTPFLIRPFVDRMLAFGVLAPLKEDGDYVVAWPDPQPPTPAEKADVGLKRTQAMGEFVTKNVNQIAGTRAWMTQVLDMEEDVADALIEEVEEFLDDEIEEPEEEPEAETEG